MYGPRKYAPKADRDRVSNIVRNALGSQVMIRNSASRHPAAHQPTQLNLL